jgi:hypothetical protein
MPISRGNWRPLLIDAMLFGGQQMVADRATPRTQPAVHQVDEGGWHDCFCRKRHEPESTGSMFEPRLRPTIGELDLEFLLVLWINHSIEEGSPCGPHLV